MATAARRPPASTSPGYLIEKSLSVDNVFVWAVIFSYFAVPPKYQFRVLFWGIFGALVLRAVVHLRRRRPDPSASTWMLFVFGAFLLFTAWKLARHDEAEVHPENNLVLRAGAQGRPVHQRVRRAEAVHAGRPASGWPRRCSRC